MTERKLEQCMGNSFRCPIEADRAFIAKLGESMEPGGDAEG